MNKMMIFTLGMSKNNINIMMLRSLVSLKETKSISRTAEQLNVTQSAISHTVRALEEILETPVLIRERRGVELTAAGMSACNSAVIALQSINDILGLSTTLISGTVHLATVVSTSRVVVPKVLEQLRRSHPKLDVNLLIGTDSEVEQWVKDGIADVGVAYIIDTENSEILYEDQFYVVSARNQGLPSKMTLTDLDSRSFIMSSSGCQQAIEDIFEMSGLTLNIRTSVSDMNALFAIVGAGYGISIVPGLAFPTNWRKNTQRFSLTPTLNCSLKMVTSNKDSANDCLDVLCGSIRKVTSSLIVD